MLSHVIRSLNRQTFKSIQSHNYVKRFYSNQEFHDKNRNDDYTDHYYQFHDDDETSRVYQEYYRRYYDNFKNKFGNSEYRQTDNDNDRQKNRKKFENSYYSFNECRFHVFTKRCIEKIGYIGAAIVVGLHFEAPLYYGFQKHKQFGSDWYSQEKPSFESEKCSKEQDNDYNGFCSQCKFCSAVISKFLIFSAPIRKGYIFAKTNYLKASESKIVELDEKDDRKDASPDNSPSITCTENLQIEDQNKRPLDPIEDICNQLQTASIDYIDQLNNLLGISLIETDPQQAMRCWSSTKANPKALFNMGVAYEKGLHSIDGISDLKQAFRYYALSASMGHKLAIYNLAIFYLTGKGDVPIDNDRAESLLRRAAELGVEPAKNYIDKLEQRRMARMTQRSTIMRSSSSAPNLMIFANCSESFNTLNHDSVNKFPHTFSIANRV